MKIISTCILVLMAVQLSTKAQIKIGLPMGAADSSAVLDLSNTGTGALMKGFILPKLALISSITWGLNGASPVNGMMVYNTVNAGSGATAVLPGLYYWYNSKWNSFNQPIATTAANASFICGNTTTSIAPATPGFTNGTPYTGTITLPYTAGVNGGFGIDANTSNGITVSRYAGSINSATGNITYNISGSFTGTTGATLSFTLNLPGGQNCAIVLPAGSFAASSLNCQAGTPAAGNYTMNTATTAGNTKIATITAASAGAYTIGTNTLNGVSFKGSGSFSVAQVGTTVTTQLTATGTPVSGGLQNFTLLAGTQSCTFPVNFTSTVPVNFTNCSNNSISSSGVTLFNGTTYTGTYTLAYTAGNGTSYNSTVQTVSGLSFTRTAGTYAAGGGNVVYNVSGVYSGTSNSVVNFSVPECSLTVSYGIIDYLRASLSNSLSAYDAATIGNWVSITAAEFANAQATLTGSTIIGSPNSDMVKTSDISWAAGNNLNMANYILPANNYLYGFSFRSGANVSGFTSNTSLSIGSSINFSGTYNNYPSGAYIPALSPVAANTIYYVVLKKQSTIVATSQYLSIFNVLNLIGNILGSNTTNYGSISGTIPTATSTMSGSTGGNTLVQFLATPTKQW